uniref:S4 domain-containing protein n=1 Tax=Bifidobacterium pullorum TaxID=78448 RepID=UPI00242BB487
GTIDEATLEAALDGLKVENGDGTKDFAHVAVGDRVAEAGVKAGLFKSISEARKTIKSGGVYLNNARVDDEDQPLGEDDFLHGRFALIRRGKKALGVVASR